MKLISELTSSSNNDGAGQQNVAAIIAAYSNKNCKRQTTGDCRKTIHIHTYTHTHTHTHLYTHTSKKKNASSASRRQITFPAEHQSNPSLFPRLASILLFVTKMINSHLAYYCTACCHGSCNYTILSFSAVSDPCREEDTAGSHGRGAAAEVNTLAVTTCHFSTHLFL